MLIYEKKVDGVTHLFGTDANVPSGSDEQLAYKDASNQEIEDILDYKFFYGKGKEMFANTSTRQLPSDDDELVNVWLGDKMIIGDNEHSERYYWAKETVTTTEKGATLQSEGWQYVLNFESVTIIFNGTVYNDLPVNEIYEAYCVGSISADFSDYPFAIWCYPGEDMTLESASPGEYTVAFVADVKLASFSIISSAESVETATFNYFYHDDSGIVTPQTAEVEAGDTITKDVLSIFTNGMVLWGGLSNPDLGKVDLISSTPDEIVLDEENVIFSESYYPTASITVEVQSK